MTAGSDEMFCTHMCMIFFFQELESLCQRINRAWPRWWHSVPWPLILLLPCVHLPICCSSLLADDSDDRVEAMLARWNSTTGRAHGVCLQWNYAYVRLQEDPAAAGERTPPGLDLVRATKPEDYVIFSETAACGGVNKPEEI